MYITFFQSKGYVLCINIWILFPVSLFPWVQNYLKVQQLCYVLSSAPTIHKFLRALLSGHYNNNNLLHLYSAFLGTQSALHERGDIKAAPLTIN